MKNNFCENSENLQANLRWGVVKVYYYCSSDNSNFVGKHDAPYDVRMIF